MIFLIGVYFGMYHHHVIKYPEFYSRFQTVFLVVTLCVGVHVCVCVHVRLCIMY